MTVMLNSLNLLKRKSEVKKLFIPLLAMGMVVFTDVSFAAFGGSRGGSGVSRSYSRPATTTTYSKPVSKPSSSYSSSSSSSSSGSYWGSSKQTPTYSNTRQTEYRSNSYQQPQYQQPRQNSAMRDIGVTAAGVAGGVLAASAITALVSSPGHSGMFTHPQYPGQYFNQQGQPVAAPQAPQAAPAPQQQVMPEQYPQQAYSQPQYQQQQPVVVVQQPKQESGGFFSFLWSFLWGVIQLIMFLGVVGALAFGIYKLIQLGKKNNVQEKVREQLDLKPSVKAEFNDLDAKALDIFYDFQKNSDNKAWVTANTKYLPVDDCLSPPSQVKQYEHRVTDCAMEHGKLRGSVLYKAVVNDGSGDVKVNQFWNFEKDAGVWKLIGFESND